ncbi:AlpA family transcriptional regulator [Anaeromyxobacter sp. SG64]|uniref:helix-turn-helix transcriptional regulator n=1 Tax=Anaeromyxobacter sp. SG64 TaxID=2925409 RepID=UPI001F56F90E|nr:AlpA family phage regulatory protein [Anaeromyxobacter sp. SG64]
MTSTSSNTPGPRRLGIAEVEARLGVDRTTIWRWYRAGKFPAPHYLGERRSWFLGEIEAWEARRMAALASPDARRGARNLHAKDAATPENPAGSTT